MSSGPHACRQIAFRPQLIKGGDNYSARNAKLGGKIPRRRKPRSRRQPPLKDGAAQFFIQPTREGLFPEPRAEREIECAGRFGHGLSPQNWSGEFTDTGSMQHTKLELV